MIGDGKRLTALLPMKAHSARVTSKNFRMIAGKPLFRWVLDEMAALDAIDRIVINTDARAILADNGLKDGDYDGKVMIRDRKPEICGDFVSMNLVLGDDVENVASDYYLMTHTTNPLLRGETIDAMIAAYLAAEAKGEADSLFTVNRHQTRFYTPEGAPINHDPANLIRTQDLPPYLEENSVCYLFTGDSFAKTGARIGEKPFLFETPRLESVDIDEPSDWYMAESLLMRVAAGEALPKE
ncbi:cytidylyltransferase domain-containing protein [Hyphococcus sp.]|jgi:CMP-N-acetylneuraminic acid synthetase|uniref:acylneuraminate cytidylyltransferase family protein n=1 Tax=Hyphococcus sp. TaxID=2038636 RepID=UPI003D1088F5